jgi:hypothetical protein
MALTMGSHVGDARAYFPEFPLRCTTVQILPCSLTEWPGQLHRGEPSFAVGCREPRHVVSWG